MWLALLFIGMMPRIVVVSPREARDAVAAWTPRTPVHAQEVADATRLLDVAPSRKLMCAAIVTEHTIRAVGLIEEIRPQTIVLWTIATSDDDSGTRLLKTFHRLMGSGMHLQNTVSPRWHIAWSYFETDVKED